MSCDEQIFGHNMLRDQSMVRTPFGWKPIAFVSQPPKPVTALGLLSKAGAHMKASAKTCDAPDGERSMGRTVAAFNAITGRDLTESEGCLLMVLLNAVRDRQSKAPHAESLEGKITYAALEAEARLKEGGR